MCHAASRVSESDGEFELVEVVREEEVRLVPVAPPRGVKEVKLTLGERECRAVSKWLPRRLKNCKWEEVYASGRNGFSKEKLFALTKRVKEGVLVIKDDHDVVFGAFFTEGLTKGTGQYYGGAEMFLFSMAEGGLRGYQTTSLNAAHMLVSREGDFYFGGSNPGAPTTPGLFLSNSLQRGTTGWSPTYANPPLSVTGSQRADGAYNFLVQSISVFKIDVFETVALRESIQTRSVVG